MQVPLPERRPWEGAVRARDDPALPVQVEGVHAASHPGHAEAHRGLWPTDRRGRAAQILASVDGPKPPAMSRLDSTPATAALVLALGLVAASDGGLGRRLTADLVQESVSGPPAPGSPARPRRLHETHAESNAHAPR